MTRRKMKDKNIRTLTRIAGGKSLAITIPIDLLRELKWEPKQRLTVRKRGKKIIIEQIEQEVLK